MFTINQNDVFQVVNSQDMQLTVKKIVEKKVSQIVLLGTGALFTAYVVAVLLSISFSMTIDPIMAGYSALPLVICIILRVLYINFFYSEALLLAAVKKQEINH
ncbi:MAG: hypothetical protein J6N72_07955 [Psychrobacter sp.]|nr:hypothetical protein [Psychrobacter sp.]